MFATFCLIAVWCPCDDSSFSLFLKWGKKSFFGSSVKLLLLSAEFFPTGGFSLLLREAGGAVEGERRRPAARRASFRVRVPPRLVELRRRIRRRRRYEDKAPLLERAS